ncbi:hypothetical protein [Parasitella parasitica]|uniref:Uncharacterized protein n=1 Tax=Parasitella parasitica TaxID=35722 RepID=A0A0B7MNU4_9FUNG|nr:hypothetical protein [Parasitella parasitica]
MYIPKKNRFEMFLKRKSSTSSNKGNKKDDASNNNWSDICSDFIKEVVLRKRVSLPETNDSNNNTLNGPNLCLDELSEFQKSYISFPEFNDSSVGNESDNDSCNTSCCATNNPDGALSFSSSSSSESSP